VKDGVRSGTPGGSERRYRREKSSWDKTPVDFRVDGQPMTGGGGVRGGNLKDGGPKKIEWVMSTLASGGPIQKNGMLISGKWQIQGCA